MSNDIQVKVTVPPELMRALNADVRRAMQSASRAVATQWVNRVSTYPALSAANVDRGPGSRWYERGFGPKRHRVDGTIWGRKTSEQLENSWATRGFGLGAIGGSWASYAPWVHHHADQARFHKTRGWKTDKAAAEEMIQRGLVGRIVRMALKRFGLP